MKIVLYSYYAVNITRKSILHYHTQISMLILINKLATCCTLNEQMFVDT